jgi:hypothetical protein
MIKLLGLEDINQVERLTLSQERHAGVMPSQVGKINFWNNNEFYFVHSLLDEKVEDHLCWGYFENNKLLSYITVQLSTHRPVWYLQKVINDADSLTTTPMKGIASLMSHVINFAEQKELFEYYSSIPLKYIRSHEKIWSNLVPERKRYDINFDHVVPALTRSKYKEFDLILMKGSTWPQDMMIRHHILQQKYRPQFTK